MKKIKCYRQGDILFVPRKSPIGSDYEPDKKGIIAEGEATGHAHRIDPKVASLYAKKVTDKAIATALDNLLVMRALKESEEHVKHEEHESLKFPAGDYDVIKQREYSWHDNLIRKVSD